MSCSMLRKIFLIHHTHMDVGYTDLAHEALDQHLDHMDRAIDLCGRHNGKQDTPAFFWTCESALLVQDYLTCRTERRREDLLSALKRGWIELTAFLTQPLTELPTADELTHNLAFAGELGSRESFPVECAMVEDIAGYAGRLPTLLQQAGIRYLVAGAGAFQVHLPWAEQPHLFYLEGKDGCRVLVWNLGIDRTARPQDEKDLRAVYGAGGSYLVLPYLEEFTGHSGRGAELDLDRQPVSGSGARARFAELETRLAREQYPYEEVLLQYGGDNQGPNPRLPDLIRQLNRVGDLPDIELTTPLHFFRYMERKYGHAVPVVRGVIADPWNVRVNPFPAALKKYRAAQRLLAAGRSWLTFADAAPTADDTATVGNALRNLHLYADHTYGLSEFGWERSFDPARGTRDGAFDRYRQAWATKHSYADTALRLTENLVRTVTQRLASRIALPAPAVLVWNDLTIPRTGLAEVYLGRDALPLNAVRDAASGDAVAFQQVGANRYLIDVPEVPALGYRCLHPTFSSPGATSAASASTGVTRLENDDFNVRIDEAGRIFSVKSRRTGREFIDQESDAGLGDFLYHEVTGVLYDAAQSGMSRDVRSHAIPVQFDRVQPGFVGPLAQSIVVEARVQGLGGPARVRREVILHKRAPRIDVVVRVDKPETEFKESCLIAFPIAGRNGVFRYDQNLGWVDPAQDLVPGAMQDAFYCANGLQVREAGATVTIACPDAPVFQLGAIRTARWDDDFPFVAERNHVYCWLYHNLQNTDNAVWQELLDTFRFSLCFHDADEQPGRDDTMAALNNPLRTTFHSARAGGCLREPACSFLSVSPESVRAHTPVRLTADTIRIRLEEPEGEPVTARIHCALPIRRAWTTAGGDQTRELPVGKGSDLVVELPGFSCAMLTVQLAPGPCAPV